MKKLLVLLLTTAFAFTLTGCGKEEKITTKTCTLNQEGLMEQTYKLTATNDEIDKIELTMTFDNSLFGIESFETLTDEQKEQIKSSMLSTLDLEEETYEGLEIKIDMKEKMVVTVIADLKKADEDTLEKIGLDFTDADMSLETAIKDMTDEGAVCK